MHADHIADGLASAVSHPDTGQVIKQGPRIFPVRVHLLTTPRKDNKK